MAYKEIQLTKEGAKALVNNYNKMPAPKKVNDTGTKKKTGRTPKK